MRVEKFVLFAVIFVVIGGCSSISSFDRAFASAFTRTNYQAVDKLLTDTPIDGSQTVLVTTCVNVDSLSTSSRFGRLLTEHIATRVAQQGFNVTEIRLRESLQIRPETGELMLSRHFKDLRPNHRAEVVIVGTYATATDHVYLTLKTISPGDNRVLAAINYTLPITENIRGLLIAQPNQEKHTN